MKLRDEVDAIFRDASDAKRRFLRQGQRDTIIHFLKDNGEDLIIASFLIAGGLFATLSVRRVVWATPLPRQWKKALTLLDYAAASMSAAAILIESQK